MQLAEAVEVPHEADVSIYAPRAGCNHMPELRRESLHRFNLRTPRGMQPAAAIQTAASWMFQSTHPARDATAVLKGGRLAVVVSIYAPRAGCNCGAGHSMSGATSFQSTHPARDATPALEKPSTMRTVCKLPRTLV